MQTTQKGRNIFCEHWVSTLKICSSTYKTIFVCSLSILIFNVRSSLLCVRVSYTIHVFVPMCVPALHMTYTFYGRIQHLEFSARVCTKCQNYHGCHHNSIPWYCVCTIRSYKITQWLTPVFCVKSRWLVICIYRRRSIPFIPNATHRWNSFTARWKCPNVKNT